MVQAISRRLALEPFRQADLGRESVDFGAIYRSFA